MFIYIYMFATYLRIQCRQPLAIVAAAFFVLLQQAPKVVTLKNRPPAALERGPPAGEKLHTDRQARTGARAKCLAGACGLRLATLPLAQGRVEVGG